MTGTDDGAAPRQEPLLWVTGALLGVGLAVALLMFGVFGSSDDPAGASASPSLRPGQSVAPSPSLVAIASPLPSVGGTVAPATALPTAAPTAAPTKTPKPTPTPNTDAVIVTWDVPRQEDCTGTTAGQIHVSWTVKRATGVSISIDGPGIYDTYAGLTGEVDLPYGCDFTVLQHTYTLRTIGGTGTADRLSRTVRTRAPSITSFSVGSPACVEGGDDFTGVNMSYEVRAATGAQLKRDGEVYANYTTKAADDIVMFDCREESQLFRLTTTGGYGDPATQAIRVNNPLFQ